MYGVYFSAYYPTEHIFQKHPRPVSSSTDAKVSCFLMHTNHLRHKWWQGALFLQNSRRFRNSCHHSCHHFTKLMATSWTSLKQVHLIT